MQIRLSLPPESHLRDHIFRVRIGDLGHQSALFSVYSVAPPVMKLMHGRRYKAYANSIHNLRDPSKLRNHDCRPRERTGKSLQPMPYGVCDQTL